MMDEPEQTGGAGLDPKRLGYNLAPHGSLARDLDVIAVPWVKGAVPARELVDALAGCIGGFANPHEDDEYHRQGQPGAKPHGRRVWSIHLGGGPYVDLSVMPRRADQMIDHLLPEYYPQEGICPAGQHRWVSSATENPDVLEYDTRCCVCGCLHDARED